MASRSMIGQQDPNMSNLLNPALDEPRWEADLDGKKVVFGVGGIDVVAHIGGLLAGMALCAFFTHRGLTVGMPSRLPTRVAAAASLALGWALFRQVIAFGVAADESEALAIENVVRRTFAELGGGSLSLAPEQDQPDASA